MAAPRHVFPRDINKLCGLMCSSDACLSERSEEVETEGVDEYIRAMSRCWAELNSDARTELWSSILEQEELHTKATVNYYAFLDKSVPREILEAIERDIDRTFPNLDLFTSGNGQQSMRNVLKAYAAFDPDVGYCQGMNFLAGLLLFYLPCEDDAFGALVFIMQGRGLRDLYTKDMKLLQLRLWQLSELMPQHLTSHLESLGVLPVLFASSWFMTCFASSFPIEIAARVLDVVLCNDLNSFVLKFAYSLIATHKKCLSIMDSAEEVLEFLNTSLPNRKLAELHGLVTEAFLTSWSDEQTLIVDSVSVTESLYDSILRVEDAISLNEALISKDEVKSRRNHSLRRTVQKMPRLLSEIVVVNVKHLTDLYKSSSIRQSLKKLRF